MRKALFILIAGCCVVCAVERWEIGPFARPNIAQPVIRPQRETTFLDPITKANIRWEALHTFNPAAAVRDGKVFVLYRAEDDTGDMAIGGHTSRIGLAESQDGFKFTRREAPVLFPGNDSEQEREWPGGCEDPRLVEREDGTYVLTYTQWNRKTYDAAIATSRDLVHWTKHGPMLAKARNGKYATLKYKSAAIVTQKVGERLIAARINGSYWMYWDEGHIHLARSSDLIDWEPLENEHGELLDVLGPRPDHFDSSFPEVGPPPVLTADGIVVIYNGKNSDKRGDPEIAAGAYSVGQALFDRTDPRRLLQRDAKPFFRPELPFEKLGQYQAGTTFSEGLVRFKKSWLLFYGCADSLVGVAATNGLLGNLPH